jgi:3-polyprenyl-4-hydroxybenzoate decarboxylase
MTITHQLCSTLAVHGQADGLIARQAKQHTRRQAILLQQQQQQQQGQWQQQQQYQNFRSSSSSGSWQFNDLRLMPMK